MDSGRKDGFGPGYASFMRGSGKRENLAVQARFLSVTGLATVAMVNESDR